MPRAASSGYLYTGEWEAAEAAWDQDAEVRPSMESILESLESQDKLPQRYLKARIKVVCEQMPERSGYVSRGLDKKYGSQVVTRDANKSLIISWDSKPLGFQIGRMLNSAEGHELLALRFNQKVPDYSKSALLWATFTAASGTREKYDTVWTQDSPGLDLLPLWDCSDEWELTPHAMGEPLEVGLFLTSRGEPHIFFCREFMQFWGRSRGHTSARFVLEPVTLEEND